MAENLAQQSLEWLPVGPCVVDSEFDDNEIRITYQQVLFDAKCSKKRAGAPDASVNQRYGRVGKPATPPILDARGEIARWLRSHCAVGDRSSDEAQRYRFAAFGLGEDTLQAAGFS